MRTYFAVGLLLTSCLLAGCSTEIERSFSPRVEGDAPGAKLSVSKVWWDEDDGRLRVWFTLANKGDRTLVLNRNAFRIVAGGQEHGAILPGSLLGQIIMTSRTASGKPLPLIGIPGRGIIEPRGPLEALGVPMADRVTLRIDGLYFEDVPSRLFDIGVEVPLAEGRK